jgi:CubicO group peptidase (beta-lactamase class C family)
MYRTNLIYIFFAFALVITGCSPAAQNPSPTLSLNATPTQETIHWSTESWQNSTPEMQGMDSALLAQMIEDISANQTGIHSVLVIRNGQMVVEAYFHPYTQDVKVHIQSVTKSVIGALVGIAMQEGILQNIDEPVLSFFPDYKINNPDPGKNAIQLKHLLSMASGLDCAEFTSSSSSMEQSPDWVQYMLDLPLTSAPGEQFGYCNGNAHLLSAILEKVSGMTTLDFANQELFQALGIPPISQADWGTDPQGIAIGGFGLHLKPVDLAKIALLYLRDGKWEDQQIFPEGWAAASGTQVIEKGDGSGYGYLWTVYPQDGHYAALGLGGQQIHIFPSKDLIVVVTAGFESYAEAPEIEKMLNEYILPAIKSDKMLAENPESQARLQAAIGTVKHPVQPVAALPSIAQDISKSRYVFEENPLGWQSIEFNFEPGTDSTQVIFNDAVHLEIGLDNLYRLSKTESLGELLLRGQWIDGQTFMLEYPYPLFGQNTLGELGHTQARFRFQGDDLQVTAKELIFGTEPVVLKGSR